MVDQTTCPNCGQSMDLSNIYLSGKADCPYCGYKGAPLKESEYLKRKLDPAHKTNVSESLNHPQDVATFYRTQDTGPETEPRSADPLDIRTLVGKLAILCTGVLLMSILMPAMNTLVPVSALGALLFATSYKLLEK